mgnify:CR=1 FL=1
MGRKLSQIELHELFLQDIFPYAEGIENMTKKPLMFKLRYPYICYVKAYLFNCTAPPGGRSIDEYKVQLILDNQKRGERGRFDDSDGKTVLIIGYADPLDDLNNGVWVLFELDKHREFAYSSNIQIYLRQILETLTHEVYVHIKHNKEIVVLARRPYLLQALEKRFDIDLQVMINKSKNL